MSEHIERDAAVKAAQDGADEWDGGFNRNRDMYIKAAMDKVPTVEPMRWIPVTERLPEELTKVLACRKNGSIEIMFFNPALTTRYPKGFSIIKNNFSWRQDNVIAWMPLPEPYKGVE